MFADLMALSAAFFWAAANAFIFKGASKEGGENGAFLSILITFLVMTVIWVYKHDFSLEQNFNTTGLIHFAIAGMLTLFLGRVFFHGSIQYLGSLRGSSVKRMIPFFSVLLGVFFLGDKLNLSDLIGMGSIFLGFGVLIFESHRRRDSPIDSSNQFIHLKKNIRIGLLYGLSSAIVYSIGNVFRKTGLMTLNDPAFGAMIGSFVGAFLFVVATLFLKSYRQSFRNTFSQHNPWLIGAGISASIGQWLYFIAIDESNISRATMIGSVDIFITLLLSHLYFKQQERITYHTVGAALLGFIGTAIIILGNQI